MIMKRPRRNNHRLNRHKPLRRALDARAAQYYNEGRLAAVMGTMCPYYDNYRSGQWFAGYRYERELMQIRGQVAAVPDVVEDELS